MTKPSIAIDFDGVLHRYSRGWQDGKIYDTLVPGFFEWAAEAQKDFKLVIHSSRASTEFGADLIRQWIGVQLRGWQGPLIKLEVVGAKPPAWITIDDRCFCFQGDWYAPELQPSALQAFKPWMNRT